MTREETRQALTKVQAACKKHNGTSAFPVTVYPYERELTGGSYDEIGIILRETGVTFNSFDIINEALGEGLFCNAMTFRKAYFGEDFENKDGLDRISEGDTIATICHLVGKEA